MEEKFLPIGSVVRLKGATRYLMVTGFCVRKAEENDDEMYDYLGCVYPQGVVSSELNFLFNHDQIEEFAFKGFVCEAETEFKKKLMEVVNEEEPAFKNNNIFENQNQANQEPIVQPVVEENPQPVTPQPGATFNTLNLNNQNNNQ